MPTRGQGLGQERRMEIPGQAGNIQMPGGGKEGQERKGNPPPLACSHHRRLTHTT